MNQNVKIAIIGCGRISGHHCRSIVETDGVELVAVCDLDIEKAKAYQKDFGAKAYDNYHQMLIENKDINTVAIVTPSGMHYEHSLDIISKYQKNIIVEKPTFMRPSQVKEVYDAAAKAGVKIFAVFQNRHNLAVQRVLLGLQKGELGKLRSANVRVRWCRPQRYYDLAPWRGTYSMDGGCLTNQGIHHIDLLKLLCGQVKRVISIHKTLGADIEVEDTATAILEFESGAIGSLEITTAARPIDFEASLSLVCENGLAQIGGIAVNELQIYSPDPTACESNSEDFSGNVYGNGHAKIYEEIAQTFKGNREFPVTFEDTFSTIQLLNAFYIADERDEWVDVKTANDSARLGRENEKIANLYRTKLPSVMS
ncbi:Gfo/Idh/MocA family protein [Leptospira stimsonii]|uniref:Gfo/Idh/MocA family oxidoreductase n=1 Tax=Leptospira stimsonii TaxID=2202203 RepID=A0ABY2MVY9_9LEPT|nr:Gfo/Idh/MocA family oxidoreductase [Leptospira stimsonii]TGK14553.1 gfo/Idh/MocA family oxidoreductase [Leptospira stimsonii]TGM09976.1 gfo/Idh/MocA family oxidoreductase [Leptospira stimsonii]